MAHFRFWAVLIAAFGLSGCQPAQYDIIPSLKDEVLYFDVDYPGAWPFKEPKAQSEASYIEVVTENEVLWAIKASESSDCTKPTDNPDYRELPHLDFPIKYGLTPHCFNVVAAAKQLPQDKDVLVRSIGHLTEGSGTFRMHIGILVSAKDSIAIWENAPSRNAVWLPASEIPQSEAAATGTAR